MSPWLRDWFAQFPYLSKLREPFVLARAIGDAVARSDAKYALADRFEEATGAYTGLRLERLVEVDLNSEALLVRANAAQAQLVKTTAAVASGSGNVVTGPPVKPTGDSPDPSPTGEAEAPRLPRRFYAKVSLDPKRPTPLVSNIAQAILSELERVRGATIVVTLDIDAEAANGFPEDVESVVRDNARDLRLTDFGFENE
jgi:hypothetical protein